MTPRGRRGERPRRSGRRGLFFCKNYPFRRPQKLAESILHQPLFAVRRGPDELADATIGSEDDLRAGAKLDGRAAAHRVETLAAPTRLSSRRRTYSPNIGSTKSYRPRPSRTTRPRSC